MKDTAAFLFSVFLISLPIYFNTAIGVYIPVLLLVIALPVLAFKIKYSEIRVYLLYYAVLACLQLTFLRSTIILSYYILKLGSIYLFLFSYAVCRSCYISDKHEKILMVSFYLSLSYALYAAFSYMLGYQNYLIPGTGGSNNLSGIGHLRCGTFVEGNYYGGYLAILALILYSRKKSIIPIIFASFIPISPLPFILIIYLLVRNYLAARKRIIAVISACAFLVLVYCLTHLENTLKYNIDNISEASSIGERLEFIRAGLAMWIDKPFLGYGLGQFGEKLPDYSVLEHMLIRVSTQSFRYIANNNIAEILSEQGIAGMIPYFLILRSIARVKINNLSRTEVYCFFIILGMTMPTFYQVIVGALLGILAGGEEREDYSQAKTLNGGWKNRFFNFQP